MTTSPKPQARVLVSKRVYEKIGAAGGELVLTDEQKKNLAAFSDAGMTIVTRLSWAFEEGNYGFELSKPVEVTGLPRRDETGFWRYPVKHASGEEASSISSARVDMVAHPYPN